MDWIIRVFPLIDQPFMTEENSDHWLHQWLDRIDKKTLLEIGCGEGLDTEIVLESAGFVVSTDSRADRLEKVRPRHETLVRLDHSASLPFSDGTFGVVLAGLSLHYFNWETTISIVREVRRVLGPGGILLARLNSTHDFHHGAAQGAMLEPNYFKVTRNHGSQFKRFFTESDCRSLFESWHIVHLQETRFSYYGSVTRAQLPGL